MSKLSKVDDAYCLVWAKKLKAIKILGGKCQECNNDNFFLLDFHHISGDKLNTINNLRCLRWSTLESEIKKCELLCSNCHSLKHSGYGRNNQIKQDFMLSKHLKKCSKCSHSDENYASLCFHHVDQGLKSFGMNQALSRKIKVSVQELNDELNKCIVLCRNCHRLKHIDTDKFNRLRFYIERKMEEHKELRPEIDRKQIWDMYTNQGMRQVDIVNHFGCAKSTISMALQKYAKENHLD